MKHQVTVDGCTFEVSAQGNKGKIKALAGFQLGVDVLAKGKNTGNGYIFKFPSNSPCMQDNYICLDYAEADYLRHLLNAMMDTKYEAIT
jgi:hypothetical protein